MRQENKKRDDEIARQQKNPTDLGWMNGWGEPYPEKYLKCKELKHENSDIDIGPPYRGIEHVCRCIPCNIVYRYDSSD